MFRWLVEEAGGATARRSTPNRAGQPQTDACRPSSAAGSVRTTIRTASQYRQSSVRSTCPVRALTVGSPSRQWWIAQGRRRGNGIGLFSEYTGTGRMLVSLFADHADQSIDLIVDSVHVVCDTCGNSFFRVFDVLLNPVVCVAVILCDSSQSIPHRHTRNYERHADTDHFPIYVCHLSSSPSPKSTGTDQDRQPPGSCSGSVADPVPSGSGWRSAPSANRLPGSARTDSPSSVVRFRPSRTRTDAPRVNPGRSQTVVRVRPVHGRSPFLFRFRPVLARLSVYTLLRI